MRMTAAVLGDVGQKLRIDEVELAPPGDGEVLVKVAASGLCASDLNAIDGKRTLAPFPLVPGHEAAGVVAQAGPRVTRLKAGDAVVMSIVPSCGDCPACVQGRRNYCQTAGRAMGRGGLLDGSLRLSRNGEPLHHFLTVSSFAQYAVVPESGAVAIDARMPLDRAALISCAVLTGVGAVATPRGSGRARASRSSDVVGSASTPSREHAWPAHLASSRSTSPRKSSAWRAGSARPMSSTRGRRIRPRRSTGSWAGWTTPSRLRAGSRRSSTRGRLSTWAARPSSGSCLSGPR
jgi:Alcohol dehydrogenase GroES-like domain